MKLTRGACGGGVFGIHGIHVKAQVYGAHATATQKPGAHLKETSVNPSIHPSINHVTVTQKSGARYTLQETSVNQSINQATATQKPGAYRRHQSINQSIYQSINQATATQKPGAHLQETPVNQSINQSGHCHTETRGSLTGDPSQSVDQSIRPLPHRNQGLTGNPNQPIKRPVYTEIQLRVILNFVVVVHTRGLQRIAYLKGVDRDPCIYKGWTENRVPTRSGQRTVYLQGVDREPCTYKGSIELRTRLIMSCRPYLSTSCME